MISTRFTLRLTRAATCARLALVAAVATAGCGTEDVGPSALLAVRAQSDSSQGALMIMMAPDSDTYEQDQAKLLARGAHVVLYEVRVDGRALAIDDLGQPWQITVAEGIESSGGYLAAGPHHFEIVASDGHAMFSGDYDLKAGQMNRLVVFGPLARLEGSFVSDPFAPPPGSEHVRLVNLLRTGQTLEVVSCSGPATCAPVSPPVPYGQSFAADFPATPGAAGWSLSGGYGFRATEMMPASSVAPVNWFEQGFAPPDRDAPTRSYVSSPVFMSPTGNVQEVFN